MMYFVDSRTAVPVEQEQGLDPSTRSQHGATNDKGVSRLTREPLPSLSKTLMLLGSTGQTNSVLAGQDLPIEYFEDE